MSTLDVLSEPTAPAGTALTARRRGGRIRRLPLEVKIGAMIVAVLFVVGVLAPLIAPYHQNEVTFTDIFSSPSLHHLFGTSPIRRLSSGCWSVPSPATSAASTTR